MIASSYFRFATLAQRGMIEKVKGTSQALWWTNVMIANLEPGNRIQLPADWIEALGLNRVVSLAKTDQGILVRPLPVATWDEIFATKLPMGQSVAEDIEVTKDDLLF